MSTESRSLQAVLAALLMSLAAPASADDSWQLFGDARMAFYASERESRDGEETREEGLRMRLRLGAESRLDEDWLVRGRLAARYTTDQDRTRFWLKTWAPTRNGLEDGDATVDELFVRYAPSGANWWVRAGRFQSAFTLQDLMGKSLDRNNSPNMEIHWTDGVHWRYALSPDWDSHVVVQGNARQGNGAVARAPLTFDDSGSRASLFTAIESTTRRGPLTQRVIGLTWMPNALATEGLNEARRDDYITVTARTAAEWPLGPTGMRGVLAGEVGYAPNKPDEDVMNVGGGSAAGGVAGQFSMTIFDFAPRHDISFLYGWADAGWLISPDFRPNDLLMEIRYRWRFSERWTLDSRLRRREERGLPAGVENPRVDDDFYLRLTGRF